jgi:hypothetical protein
VLAFYEKEEEQKEFSLCVEVGYDESIQPC